MASFISMTFAFKTEATSIERQRDHGMKIVPP
jgi:hypothetical protein